MFIIGSSPAVVWFRLFGRASNGRADSGCLSLPEKILCVMSVQWGEGGRALQLTLSWIARQEILGGSDIFSCLLKMCVSEGYAACRPFGPAMAHSR